MLHNEITKKNLKSLVLKFYAKVIKDDLIGPIFTDILGKELTNDTWKAHIQLLTDFWASIALGDFAYTGSPFAPHVAFRERLSAQAFDRWLELFSKTLHTIFEPAIAELFHVRGRNIAGNFMRNLNIH
ncbi:group III truncated hemoglobin [Sulfurimonas sp. SAG-AH-194-I05]|nr:group III truncated hemoglobin [Sulfurimonas sp. SAG-AH-194-I05]MDF1875003.1 group III truncated hemoglobin [Sulfurimonas sp. SAG-AH-194-I05]